MLTKIRLKQSSSEFGNPIVVFEELSGKLRLELFGRACRLMCYRSTNVSILLRKLHFRFWLVEPRDDAIVT